MVQAQKIYPINLLDLSHANHGPECRMTAVELYLSPTDNNMMQAQKVYLASIIQHDTAQYGQALPGLGFATSNIDAPETPQSLMKED